MGGQGPAELLVVRVDTETAGCVAAAGSLQPMSWESLLSILRDAADDIDGQLAQPPVACPNDGEPLQTGPNGELFCKFDGWQWHAYGPARGTWS